MIRARKIEYVVHMERLDDDGNVIEELTTQQPITAFAHLLGQVGEQVAAIVARVDTQPPTAD